MHFKINCSKSFSLPLCFPSFVLYTSVYTSGYCILVDIIVYSISVQECTYITYVRMCVQEYVVCVYSSV